MNQIIRKRSCKEKYAQSSWFNLAMGKKVGQNPYHMQQ